MTNEHKSMDFFRPVRSTDPLVSRPVVKPAPAPIPKTRVSSTPPSLKLSPDAHKETNPYLAGKPAVHQTVVVEETVVQKTIVAAPAPEPKPEPKKPVHVQKPAPEPEKDDDWFESLEKEGFFDEKPEEKSKVSYPFGGESPFLKSVKVEKRPLSNSIPQKNIYERPVESIRPVRRPDPVRIVPKAKKNGLSLALIILITIILGIAAGVGVFFIVAG